MASLSNRYNDTHRYAMTKPSALKAGLKTAHTMIGHINVSKAINMNAHARRQANINSKKRTMGKSLEAWGKPGGALSWRQNDPVFTLRSHKAKASVANVWSEQPNTVWATFTGMTIPDGMSQDEYEDHFMFSGTSTRDYIHGEPGSTIGVSLTGLRTIWIGGTDVYAGDRLRWRLPAIDDNVRTAEEHVEKLRRQDGRHQNQLVAIFERADPSDVALAPKTWMQRAFERANENSNSQGKKMRAVFERPYHNYNQTDTPSNSFSDAELLVVSQLTFAQWVALATVHWLNERGSALPSVAEAYVLLGYGGGGVSAPFEELYKFYGSIFAGMLPGALSEQFKITTKNAEKDKSIAAIQKQAAQAQFIATMIAHNAERTRQPLTAVEHAPGWGKVDVFN